MLFKKLKHVSGKICNLMDKMTMKKCESGANTTETKAMSLFCRYKLKRDVENTSAAIDRDSIRRDSIVVLPGKEDQGELYYRVLGVFKKYSNKWFHPKPNEESPAFSLTNPPNVRLSLRLMATEHMTTTTLQRTMFSTVRNYDEYEVEVVHRNVKADEILRLEGHLSPDTY